ncbi:MAG: efflux RND transporter periplasmic adaptor subunit, partial [Myxococcota bacterium]
MIAVLKSKIVRRILFVGAMALSLLVAFALGGWLLGGGSGEPVDEHAEHADAEVWTCSMHPQIRQDAPGSCPICGMDLIPVTSSAGGGSTDRVVLSERARALSKLRTTSVKRQTDAAAEVHLLGRIEAAESTRRNVTTWVGGRIDRLNVNVTGERVRRGQTIATLYSPEVYSAHQDLITARSQVMRLADGAPGARQAAVAALGAARERLRLVGVPDAELQRMVESSEPTRALAIRSPFSGTVIERVATEGAYVETGATLYRVADLGTLWVQLDAYESDLGRLEVGQSVELRVDAMPGRSFDGRLAFIDPTLDTQRRTARVRVVVDNADGSLRPGMFAEAIVSAPPIGADAPLVIPETSALFTGKRSVVYVEQQTADS